MRFFLLATLLSLTGLVQAQTVYSHGVYAFPGEPVAVSDDVRYIVIYATGATALDVQIDSDGDIITQSHTVPDNLPVAAALPVLPNRILTLTPDAGSITKIMLLDAPVLPEVTPEATPPVTGDGLAVWALNPVQDFVGADGQIASLDYDVPAGDGVLFAALVGLVVLILIVVVQRLWSGEL